MAVNRYAGLKRNLMLATAISATLSGCASVEYSKVDEEKRIQQVVTMPKPATDTAYATPAPVSGDGTMSTLSASGAQPTALPAVQGTTAKGAVMATAALAPADQQATQQLGQPVLVQPLVTTASANPLVAGTNTPGMEMAYATPALVVLPQPRPDIIRAANTLPNIPTPLEAASESAGATIVAPESSAEKDVQFLQQRLASAEPVAGDLNPLVTSVAVPTPRPVNAGLEAYASSPEMLTSDAFDTSAPAEIQEKSGPTLAPSSKLQALITKYAQLYSVPEALVHRVVRRESTYNPSAYNSGNYGLMQIRYNTARSLGYKGPPSGLFDAETNLKYAVKYLRGAFMVAENNHDNAVRLYARGYYYDAKRKGLLAQVQ